MRVSCSVRSPRLASWDRRSRREVLEAQRAVVVLVAGAPQQRSHAGQQLAQRERLDEVVVGAGVEAGDAVVDLLARGQHQHGRAVAAVAQPAADLEAVDVGHRDVEDHGVVGRAGELLERFAPVDRLRHFVALERQRARQRALHGRLVVDDQYARLFGHVA